jgi:hypothetical protein
VVPRHIANRLGKLDLETSGLDSCNEILEVAIDVTSFTEMDIKTVLIC